jgi:hypothetical protein
MTLKSRQAELQLKTIQFTTLRKCDKTSNVDIRTVTTRNHSSDRRNEKCVKNFNDQKWMITCESLNKCNAPEMHIEKYCKRCTNAKGNACLTAWKSQERIQQTNNQLHNARFELWNRKYQRVGLLFRFLLLTELQKIENHTQQHGFYLKSVRTKESRRTTNCENVRKSNKRLKVISQMVKCRVIWSTTFLIKKK